VHSPSAIVLRDMRLTRALRIALLALIVLSTGCAARPRINSAEPGATLPPDLARVLSDYENAWQRRNAVDLAALFAEDGFVLPSGSPPVRGRAAIEQHYTGAGGPLYLNALAWAAEGNAGYIIGEYAHEPTFANRGKFTITLTRAGGSGSRWLIMSDMDSRNTPPAPPAPPE